MQIRRKLSKDPGACSYNRLTMDAVVHIVDEESPSCYLQKVHPREGYGWMVYSKAEYEIVPDECWEDVTASVNEIKVMIPDQETGKVEHELWCGADKLAILCWGGKYRLVRDRRNWCSGDVMYRVERNVSS